MDQQNLYREENYTDLKAGSVRRLIPVQPDGSTDAARTEIFIGTTQLMTNEGPLPVQARLMANSLQEALSIFPDSMRQATMEMIEQFEKMQQKMKAEADSRIIVPGQ
ncbi:MAG: cytoplasmic protein [Desulfobacterales bacterium]|nr:cytoplasmic protein [Desulfobacterales bacterium]MDJ0884314.1 cytoplasmic protein [Desulfobacterales bacterium]